MGILIGLGISILFILISLLFRLAKVMRLTIPLIYITVVNIFFNDWYKANTFLAHFILAVLTGLVIISWIISIYRKIRERKVERNCAELDAIINSKRLYYTKEYGLIERK